MDVQFETFDESLDGWRAALGPAASAADAVDAFLADAGLDADGARRVRQGLRAGVEADAADRMELMSLQWMGNEIEYGGDLFGDLPVGGYGAVVAALAGGLDVRLGVEVDGIQATGADVQAHTTDGNVEHASHVVVTVPLGVLKRGTPRFSPALPPAHLDAIGRLGFGRYEKVVLQFERPFWHDRGVSHLQVFPLDPDQPSLWVFDLAGFGFGPTLACHAFHSATPNVLDGSPDDAAHWALELLGQALGGPCPAPSAVAVTGWAHDPFSGGAYSHVPPGADPSLLDRIGTPVGGRVLFAGEHTQSARVGYADGALSSGVREAKRLLSAPSVRLGPIAAG